MYPVSHELLSQEEETRLLAAATAGDADALEAIVAHNQRLVYYVCRRYIGVVQNSSLDDLVQIGNIGLLEAVRRFDPSRGVRFSTYAVHWIRASVYRDGVYRDSPIHVTTYDHDRSVRIRQARSALETDGEPDIDSIATATGSTGDQVHRALITEYVSSMDAECGESDTALVDLLESDGSPEEIVSRMDEIQTAVKRLPQSWQRVIRMRFGLDDECPLTMAEIADRIGCSIALVYKVEKSALERMRKIMDDDVHQPSLFLEEA